MIHVIEHSIIDSIKLLPFLFITYLLMEFIEHKISKKSRETIKKSGKWGPFLGSAIGIFPQCGFSVAASNFYAGRVITLGTLISVYLSTSDEMLPIFISEAVPIMTILKILAVKFTIGMISGFVIDFVLRMLHKEEKTEKIEELCKSEHCDCRHGIFKSALKHSVNIFIFILFISIIINIGIHYIGEERIASFVQSNPVFGPAIAGIIGLIPNCAASVILTKLYLEHLITAATMISGLLVSAGVGLAVLFRMNKDVKENIKIVTLLYTISVISGVIIQMIGIRF